MSTPDLIFGVTPGRYKKGKTVVELIDVAVWNEYGAENIPPRPAFRRGMEAGLAKNKKQIGAQLKNITRRILTGRSAEVERSLTVLLTGIGKSAKAETKRIIEAGDETPNAPATVAKKGFNHPLFHTGELLKHVDYEVRK